MTKSKKKQMRTLIVMTVLLLVLCIAGVVAVKLLKEEEEEVTEESYDIITISDSNLSQVTFSNTEDSDIMFYKEGDQWYYEKDRDFPANQSLFSQLTQKLNSIKGFRKLEATEENMEQFGIKNPSIQVQLGTKDGRTFEYDMGLYNSAMGGYYLYDRRENVIYLVDDTFSTVFGNDAFAYAQCEEFPEFDISTFRDMTVTNGDKLYEFLYAPDGDAANMIQSKWYFGKPFGTNRACVESSVDELRSAITSLTFTKLAAYNIDQEDLEAFGIDGTKKVVIQYVEETTDEEGNVSQTFHDFVINVGNLDESGSNYYVHTADYTLLGADVSDTIHLMSKSSLDQLLYLELIDYAYKNVFSAAIADMKDITFYIGEEAYTFTVEHRESDDTTEHIASYEGKELENPKDFNTMYGAWVGLMVNEFISDNNQIAKETNPAFTIVIHQEKETPLDELVINFTEYNAGYYQVEVNGTTDCLVGRTDVSDAVDALHALVESLN